MARFQGAQAQMGAAIEVEAPAQNHDISQPILILAACRTATFGIFLKAMAIPLVLALFWGAKSKT
jgi:hypothetical protein